MTLPDNLVAEQEAGQVLFVCGAGVSMGAGLPSFRKLVEGVYGDLGEHWSRYHAEDAVMSEGGGLAGQYDRALRSLERRLDANDVREASSLRRRIRTAVERQLFPSEGADLSGHLALLDLSKGLDGVPRILTTNFDTLFERAWQETGHGQLRSYAGRSMPRPGSSLFEGVLHLHGGIADAEVGVERSELVLTSAEFGDAYVRSGWAARYVYDLSRRFTLVLVGYSADDPPMRYLLEAIEDDRNRYADLKAVYALVPAAPGTEQKEEALWQAKGVQPLPYRSDSGSDHGSLYSTLSSWRDYARAPREWRECRLRELFSLPWNILRDADTAEAEQLLLHGDAARILATLSPDATWWAALSVGSSLAARPEALGAWLGSRAKDGAMVRACAANPPRAHEAFRLLLSILDFGQGEIAPHVAAAWKLLARSREAPGGEAPATGWYAAAQRFRSRKVDHAARVGAIDALRPRLVVRCSSEELNVAADGGAEGLGLLVRASFECPGHPSADEVLDVCPGELEEEVRLFKVADRALAEAMDEAAGIDLPGAANQANRDVRDLVSPDPMGLDYGFAPLAKFVARLWSRIASKDSALARRLAAGWADGLRPLGTRLYLHALAAPDPFQGPQVSSALLELDDETFWISSVGNEAEDAIAARWTDFSQDARLGLERRILEGPPAGIFRRSLETGAEGERLVEDWLVYRRLEPVRRSGGQLSPAATEMLDAMVARYPAGTMALPSDEARPAEAVFHEPQKDTEQLEGTPDEDLVQAVLRQGESGWLGQGDLWQLLCRADPVRACRVAAAPGFSSKDREKAVLLLLSATQQADISGLEEGLCRLLVALPRDAFSGPLGMAACIWIWQRARGATPEALMPPLMASVWDAAAVAMLAKDDVEGAGETGSGELLETPGAALALCLLGWAAKHEHAAGEGFGSVLGPRLRSLATASGPVGLQARMLLVRDLAFLDKVDPEWAFTAFVPLLTLPYPEASALWSARGSSSPLPPRLFNPVKASFLEAVETSASERRATHLSVELLKVARAKQRPWGAGYDLKWTDIRSTLSRASPQARQAVSRHLHLWMAGDKGEVFDRANRWWTGVGPLFRHIWPQDKAAQDGTTSKSLAWMSLECGNASPEAVATVEPYLVSEKIPQIDGWFLIFDVHKEAARTYPVAFLTLLGALVGTDPVGIPFDLGKYLDAAEAADPGVVRERPYMRLEGLRRRSEA